MNSLSNYLNNKGFSYAGGQQAYLQRAERAIEDGVHQIHLEVSCGKDPTAIFFDVMRFFQKERRQIAEDFEDLDCCSFGTPRTDRDLPLYFASTPLAVQYADYNTIFMDQLKDVLSGMKRTSSGFHEKKRVKEEMVLGRKIKFEVEILDIPELVERTKNAGEKNLQRALTTKKDYCAVMGDYDLMKRLKKEDPKIYQGVVLNTVSQDFCFRFPRQLKNNIALCTLRAEVGGKLHGMSRYLSSFDTDGVSDPISKIVQSPTLILHQDTFLIDETLEEISKIFKEAVSWTSEQDVKDLKDRVALFRFMYSHCTPCIRGDGAIGDWFELAIYRYHGFAKTKFSQDKLPCFETLASISLSRYMSEYDKIITVEK
jgi:hypothetical protein